MSVELDWQIVDEDAPWSEEPPPPVVKPRRRSSRRLWLAAVLIPILAIAAVATYFAWTYHTQLNRVAQPVEQVARLEAQAMFTDDRDSFMALQDPDDPTWRAIQGRSFGRLQRIGLPEFGWKATGAPPQFGQVSLEPGGARLDVTYQFSVTEPMLGGPVTITLRMPEFYKPTPSGWVHAAPGTDFWGPQRTQTGKRITTLYFQRDAAVVEPLIPHLDDLAVRLCDSLHCPPQMTVAFENSMIGRYSFFSGGQPMMIFPSPHLLALPTDARSRDELYRALETRLVRLLIFQASGAHFYSNRMVSREITRWELSRVGLTGPFITEAIARTLATELHSGAAQPLGTISLRSGSPETDTPGEAMLSLALAFLDQSLGNGTVERLIPAMDSSATLGDAIRTALPVNPETLEPAWQRYLRAETGLSAKSILLSGDLALRCENDNGKSSIWHIWADGTELAQISDDKQDAWLPTWSPDGKWLAYIQNDRVMVMNANSRQAEAVVEGLSEQAPFGWLSDDRLQVTEQDRARLINLHTSQDIVITGTQHVWSPDGRHVAYLDFPLGATYPAAGRDAPQIWIADTDGRNARLVGRGYGLEWSPDSTRLAFLGDVHVYSSVPNHLGFVYAREVQIVDVASGSAATLARGSDLLQSLSDNKGATGMMTNLTWSPDSSNIAVGMWRPGGFSMVWVLSAKSGAVLAQRSGTAVWWPYRAWSPDSRHLAVWATVSSQQDTLSLMDVQTGQSVELPVNKLNVSSGNWFEQLSSNAFDWSPDGNWLAVAQEPSGVLLVAQDLTDMRWLDTPHCFSVTWKPG